MTFTRTFLLFILAIFLFISCQKTPTRDLKLYLTGHKWYYTNIYGGPPPLSMTHCDSTVWYTFKSDGTGYVGNDDTDCKATIYNINFTYTVNSDIRLITLNGIEGAGTAQEWYIDTIGNDVFKYTYSVSTGGGNTFDKHATLVPR